MLSQPLHHAIVVVDVEKFGDKKRGDLHRSEVRDGLFAALEQAFDEAEIDWSECSFQTRGDGALILVPARYSERQLVDRVPSRLTAGLLRHNARVAVEGRIRLRLAFHSGPVEIAENGSADSTVIFACRLVDSDEAREAQRASKDLITIIASNSFYENSLVHEPAAEPDTYRRVPVSVKEVDTIAWIRSTAPLLSSTLTPATKGPLSNRDSSTEVDELANILLAVPPLLREDARSQLLDLLPNGMASEMPQNVDPWPYTRALARLCFQHTGGLDYLLGALRTLGAEPRQIHQLEALRYRYVGVSEEPLSRLTETLFRIPCLTDPMASELVVHGMRRALGERFLVEGQPGTLQYVSHIASLCWQNPYRLTILMGLVSRFGPEAPALADLRLVIGDLTDSERPADTFTNQHRTGLLALLAGVVLPNVADLYGAAGGRAAPDLGDHTTYPRILHALESLNARRDGLPRTLAFVEHVAAHVDSELKIKLQQWTRARAAEMDLIAELADLRDEVRRQAAAANHSPSAKPVAYLVLKIEREGPTGDRFRLTDWRQLGDESQWAPERGKDRTGSLDTTKTHVASLIERIEVDWGERRPDIRIEFVLDTPDLSLDVDQWPWENDPHSEPMGCRYPVTVRSAERMRARKYHRNWQERWDELVRQLRRDGRVDTRSSLRGYGSGDHGVRQLRSALHQRPDVVSLTLSAPPQPDEAGGDEVSVGIKAGLPLIWWHREDCDHPEFTETVDRLLLEAEDQDHLLHRVRHARVAAYAQAEDEKHIGASLTVLYDDPARLVVPHQPGHPVVEGAVG
ncbi:hypothetical protein FKR81_00390 [Lentzea tibetensis]|uniref:Uncharacterized protein n=1 Tax=Lentzea tibetensis TaxID=2591470 RepID=A0A563F274_9PSEU|nr:hypothetical protein [Lentzea tibetensis]TWP54065.1 hypothetical protein FKR81_00390 [Lentzea tibetensis]